MLSARQVWLCTALAAAFWGVAALAIRWTGHVFADAAAGVITFAASLPAGWFCIWLMRRVAQLSALQIAPACLVALGVAGSIDGLALRFAPRLYAADDLTCRLAAAWLLWGYGVAAITALLMARRPAAGGAAN